MNTGRECRYHRYMSEAMTPLPPDLLAVAKRLLHRPADCHKYDFGRVLVIGGSRTMAGAPALAGMAALRGGAGLVEVCVPQSVAPTVAGFDPALIVHGLPESASGSFDASAVNALLALVQHADVVVCGPGMGRSPALLDLVLALWRDFPRTLLLDADGLNALAELPEERLKIPAGPRILTPHAGEMRRLHAGTPNGRPEFDAAVDAYARSRHAVLVLKGHRSRITDGSRQELNSSGGPGLATAGTGDVLSGVIGAVAAQGIAPFDAARFGVWLHGVAGELACEALTAPGMTAGDVLDALPMAWKALDA
jgi:NAD(P)H-hydrate epimerase